MVPLLAYEIHKKQGYICIILFLSFPSSISPYFPSPTSLVFFPYRNSVFSMSKRYEVFKLFYVEKEKMEVILLKGRLPKKDLRCSTKV